MIPINQPHQPRSASHQVLEDGHDLHRSQITRRFGKGTHDENQPSGSWKGDTFEFRVVAYKV